MEAGHIVISGEIAECSVKLLRVRLLFHRSGFALSSRPGRIFGAIQNVTLIFVRGFRDQ
jgi:hypothetical protein